MNEESRKTAILIALRTEQEDYKDEILSMLFQWFATMPQDEAIAIFDFWETYRPWTIKLVHALVEFDERTRANSEQIKDNNEFISV